MLQEPSEMLSDDVEKVLIYFGYSTKNKPGSHFVYNKEGLPPIMIVKHHNKIGRWDIKKINEILNLEEWREKNR